jgi:2-polyprenyl-6-methoxyphenol hydroxylase-like FAD-dependent oxidoreductase
MDFDVVIVGGGLAGLGLAAALRRSTLSVALVEGRAPTFSDTLDSRIYAISPANATFLDEVGAWGHLDATRMEAVRAMEVHGDAGGRLDFTAYGCGVPELAWILESSLMQRELWETVKRQGNLTLFCPARPQALTIGPDAAVLALEDGRELSARLIVAADGAESWTRAAAVLEGQHRGIGSYRERLRASASTPTTSGAWSPTSPPNCRITAPPSSGSAPTVCWPGCRCRANACPWSGRPRRITAAGC